MRVLVVHQNFPGQFGQLVRTWMQRPGWDVRALGRESAPGLSGFDGLQRYSLTRPPHPKQHPYLRQMEAATLHGQATARAMLKQRHSGFTPDVILAHPGWGETLYAKDVYPDARLIHLCEWYYSADGADVGFDTEFPISFDDRARIRTWNALHALNLTQCDAAVTATQWQRRQHPEIFLSKIAVQHEGIDPHGLAPDPMATFTTNNGITLKAGDPNVTFVARNLEPYRGFHIFMRALERIQQKHPQCHALIVGGDDVSYGKRPNAQGDHGASGNWREVMLAQVRVDPTRTHFLGRVPKPQYLRVLQVSAAHVYLTYPFVLSWSLLEAMACGVPLIASNTAPVCEVLRHGENAHLVEFFDPDALAQKVLEVLHNPTAQMPLRQQAKSDARGFGQEAALAGYDELLGAK